MIPPLVRLPATVLDHDALEDLACCVDAVAPGRTVLVGVQRASDGAELDEFVLVAALAARRATSLGVAARIGAGRYASIVAREATAAQLLGACDVLVLEGEPAACRDAAVVVTALFVEGVHTVTTPTTQILGARNRPVPNVDGGPPVCWRVGPTLFQLVEGEPVACGRAVDLDAAMPLPEAEHGVLVALGHEPVTPGELAAVLAR